MTSILLLTLDFAADSSRCRKPDHVQHSGGQTCSTYEPHIVKPMLQRAAT